MRKIWSKLLYSLMGAAALLSSNAYAVAPDQLGGSAFPLTFISQQPINLVDGFNQQLQIMAAQLAPAPGGPTGYVTGFSTSISGNPLLENAWDNLALASVNISTPLLSGIGGRTVYPNDVTIMALGGNAGGGTSVKIVCYPSALVVATFPIAALISGIPVTPYSSTGATVAGTPLASGCLAGDGVYASGVGTLTTATGFVINMPFTVQ